MKPVGLKFLVVAFVLATLAACASDPQIAQGTGPSAERARHNETPATEGIGIGEGGG